jgi:hypothetical protein
MYTLLTLSTSFLLGATCGQLEVLASRTVESMSTALDRYFRILARSAELNTHRTERTKHRIRVVQSNLRALGATNGKPHRA